MLEAVVRIVLLLVGLAIAVATLLSAVRTTVLPRAVPSRIARVVFITLRAAFNLRVGRAASYEKKDRIFANYGPFALLALLFTWLVCVYSGFALAEGAVADHGTREALRQSGSSLFTLGFDSPNGAPLTVLCFAEAACGLLLVALLISYLPAIYGAFSRREALVNKMESRGSAARGGAPDGGTLLTRAWALERFDQLDGLWRELEDWFVDIEETHTTFPALVFFRSPHPDQSWITTAGAILDGASLQQSSLDVHPSVDARLCIRAGYLALRRIADFYRVTYNPDATADDTISVSRDDWNERIARMRDAGLPIRTDLDAAWRDFRGWRCNYDRVLVALAMLTQAPYAEWSSDRSIPGRIVPPLIFRRAYESMEHMDARGAG